MRLPTSFQEYRQRRWWPFVVRPLVFLALSFVVARFVVSLVGAVDWDQVATALGRLSWVQAPVFVALLLVRQAFNSVPLAVYVPGLGFWRGFQNDLTANLVATMAPPPGDFVVRASMFRSWGITVVDAMPGVTLNSLAFYVIRFSVPFLGVLLLLRGGVTAVQVGLAVASLALAALLVAGLVLVSRGERFAALSGRRAGMAVSRVRDDVDPGQWAAAAASFRGRMSTRLVKGSPPSFAALTAMVLTDALIVLVALRLVGVSGGELPAPVVLGTFLLAYPLTALPLAGLGVLDAVLVVGYTEVAGSAAEPEIVAALVAWRVVTLLGTLALGAAMFGLWKGTAARRGPRRPDGAVAG